MRKQKLTITVTSLKPQSPFVDFTRKPRGGVHAAKHALIERGLKKQDRQRKWDCSVAIDSDSNF